MFDTFREPFTSRGGVVLHANGPNYEVHLTDRPADMLTLRADGWQHDEQTWLAVRLREVAEAWEPLITGGTLVLLRQVVGASTDDKEVTAAATGVPEWLTHGPPC